MFPCWYSQTNTPTAVSPLTGSLVRQVFFFFLVLWAGKRRQHAGAREHVRESRRLGGRESVDGGASVVVLSDVEV